jgi:hypothetical protein
MLLLLCALGVMVAAEIGTYVCLSVLNRWLEDRRLRQEVSDDCYNFIKNMRRYRRTGLAPWE